MNIPAFLPDDRKSSVPSNYSARYLAPASKTTGTQAQPPSQADPSPQEISNASILLKNVIQERATELEFHIDSSFGKPIARITDRQTGEIIRQIPSKELVALAKSLDRMQGLLLGDVVLA
jgi:flagellar protein FlaG